MYTSQANKQGSKTSTASQAQTHAVQAEAWAGVQQGSSDEAAGLRDGHQLPRWADLQRRWPGSPSCGGAETPPRSSRLETERTHPEDEDEMGRETTEGET